MEELRFIQTRFSKTAANEIRNQIEWRAERSAHSIFVINGQPDPFIFPLLFFLPFYFSSRRAMGAGFTGTWGFTTGQTIRMNGVTYVYNAQTEYWTVRSTNTPQSLTAASPTTTTPTGTVVPNGNPSTPPSNGTPSVVPVVPLPDPINPDPVTPTSSPWTPPPQVYGYNGAFDHGRDFLAYAQNGGAIAGLVASPGDFLHTPLYWRSLNGTWRAVTNKTRGDLVLKWDYALSGRKVARWKAAGKWAGVFGLGLTGIDMTVNGRNVQNSTDFAFGIIGFGPVYGWALSGAYSLTNMVYDYYTPPVPPPKPRND